MRLRWEQDWSYGAREKSGTKSHQSLWLGSPRFSQDAYRIYPESEVIRWPMHSSKGARRPLTCLCTLMRPKSIIDHAHTQSNFGKTELKHDVILIFLCIAP